MQILTHTAFTQPKSVVAGCIASLALFFFIVFFPNLPLIGQIFGSDNSLYDKAIFVFYLCGSFFTNQSVVSVILSTSTIILFGTTTALIVDVYSAKRGLSRSVGALSFVGTLAGLFGIGCAACGSLLLAALLAQFGVASLHFLPWNGIEISFVSIMVLVYVNWRLLQESEKPAVCVT
jgi:hypothetical protein